MLSLVSIPGEVQVVNLRMCVQLAAELRLRPHTSPPSCVIKSKGSCLNVANEQLKLKDICSYWWFPGEEYKWLLTIHVLAWRWIKHQGQDSSQTPTTETRTGDDISIGRCQAGQGLWAVIWSKGTPYCPKALNLWLFWLILEAARSNPGSWFSSATVASLPAAAKTTVLCCSQSVYTSHYIPGEVITSKLCFLFTANCSTKHVTNHRDRKAQQKMSHLWWFLPPSVGPEPEFPASEQSRPRHVKKVLPMRSPKWDFNCNNALSFWQGLEPETCGFFKKRLIDWLFIYFGCTGS